MALNEMAWINDDEVCKEPVLTYVPSDVRETTIYVGNLRPEELSKAFQWVEKKFTEWFVNEEWKPSMHQYAVLLV